MIRYWFEFDFTSTGIDSIPPGIQIGCGVTGHNYEDVFDILRDKVFKGGELPGIRRMIEDVNIETLDQGHVLPNMLPPIWRGVWYPMGYQY
ncbi:hypothetical protein [Chitinophaga sancti]|uniref:Uncharacterized protein n=1 Tax=Chitinophaga sancti TaxID=1004 RepID=A0A1K1NGS7_9BACT|nr:hypothetical protein [Chitinophaga sancti]WQD63237.1 hypothetical protein U0033_02440 [Chitinophaga sancti]WQG91137.1 hypothetical protein SR876_06475 [Chitinophaga sancti]SFW34527.1 hypothetical protein SAMN05661012_01294 [Chitinophaga sancti]